MIIPGSWIAKLTFPGILVQGKIREKIIGNDAPVGYKKLFQMILTTFLANSTLCIFAGAVFLKLTLLSEQIELLDNNLFGFLFLLIAWLSFSFGLHAFPYRTDAKQLWLLINESVKNRNFLAIIGYPFAAFIYLVDILKFIWIDAIYALFLIYYAGIMIGVYA